MSSLIKSFRLPLLQNHFPSVKVITPIEIYCNAYINESTYEVEDVTVSINAKWLPLITNWQKIVNEANEAANFQAQKLKPTGLNLVPKEKVYEEI